MIVNLDQTPSEFVQSPCHSVVEKSIVNVDLVGLGDKRSINATFVVTLYGRFLPMQLIYDGKTTGSIHRVDFPSSFSLSANPKHFLNPEIVCQNSQGNACSILGITKKGITTG